MKVACVFLIWESCMYLYSPTERCGNFCERLVYVAEEHQCLRSTSL